jgi:aminoglycoside phosphotransferase family enzyme/adenylate kinase family enzyme
MQKTHVTLVEALHNPACYEHPVGRVKMIETHISWVFLAGKFAYKLKKPVNFGFLDFSTLSKRHHYCLEELRLNRRFAPQLYLAVVSVGGSPESPVLGSDPAIDYLVKMKRFARQNELDRMLEHGQLTTGKIEKFADYIAHLHLQAPQVEQRSYFGSPDSIMAPALENFSQIRPLLPDDCHQKQLAELVNWCQASFKKLRGLLKQRKSQGFIRECHGDVHLANMVWLEEQPVLFDCIEFNENFRCIDTINDSAFLLMDLDDRGAGQLGWHFLNRYLEQTGDYQGLPLLNFYKCYRAMVRAKVCCLRSNQPGLSDKEKELDVKLAQSYLDLATEYTRPRTTPLIITHGFSGSGKTTFIDQLAPLCGAVSIHSDIERKRMHGMQPTEKSRSEFASGIYTEQANQQTYNRLLKLAELVLVSGLPVIIDATFLAMQQRTQMQQLAKRLKSQFIILDFSLREEELIRRVEKRSRQTAQVSEATVEVLSKQMQIAQPLSVAEKLSTIIIHPGSSAKAIAEHLIKTAS